MVLFVLTLVLVLLLLAWEAEPFGRATRGGPHLTRHRTKTYSSSSDWSTVKEPTVYVDNLYEALGVAPNSTTDQIKDAYKAIVFQNHPDRNNTVAALYTFRNASHAYQVLGRDPKLRAEYDSKYLSRMYLSVLEDVGTEVLRPLAMDVAVPLINFTARALGSFLKPVIESSISTTSAVLEIWGEDNSGISGSSSSGGGGGGGWASRVNNGGSDYDGSSSGGGISGSETGAGGGGGGGSSSNTNSFLPFFSRIQRVGDLMGTRNFESQQRNTVEQAELTSTRLKVATEELSKLVDGELALNRSLDNLFLLQEVVARRQAECRSVEQNLRLEFDAAAGQEARLRVQCDTGADYVATTAREKASISAAIANADAEAEKLEILLLEVRTQAAELRRQEASIEGSMQQMAVTNTQLGAQLSSAQDALSLVREQLRVAVSNQQAAENEVSKVNVDLTQAQEELSRHLSSKASTERRIDQLKKKEVALSQVLSRLERERAVQLELKRQRELTASQRLQKEKIKELDALREKQLEIERSLRQEEDRIKKLGEL